MEKKIYTKPEAMVMELDACSMLDVSLTKSDTPVPAGDSRSNVRGGFNWDDYEEENL